jgi:sulfatase maturation enzyme AslB (radical SAM superfamily)
MGSLSNLNLQYTTLDEYWNSQSVKDIQQQMLYGKSAIKECRKCKQDETNFGSSMRTDALRDYGFDSADLYEQELSNKGWLDAKSPTRLEIHVGNTCNLKCLTCCPRDSSMFLDEDRRLNISNYRQKDFSYSEDQINEIFDFVNSHNIDILDLRGGESMLIPLIKNRLLSMPEKTYKNTKLRVQTNGTLYNEHWKNIFEKFHNIEIMISIDGFGPVNEYVRFPSNWVEIDENVDHFRSHNPGNMYINTVVSNISVLRLDELLAWCYEKNVYCHLSPLTNPEIFKFTNLPVDLLEQAKQKLKQFEHHPGVQSLFEAEHEFDPVRWSKFCSMIDRRDQYRQNRIFNIYPEMKQFWDPNQ